MGNILVSECDKDKCRSKSLFIWRRKGIRSYKPMDGVEAITYCADSGGSADHSYYDAEAGWHPGLRF